MALTDKQKMAISIVNGDIKTPTVSLEDEMKIFVIGLKVHIERYNGISIHKGGKVHRDIIKMVTKIKESKS